MGRKTKNKKLRIRFKDGSGTRSVLVVGNNHKSAGRLFGGGRILRIGKFSLEEELKVGEYFPFGNLLKELKGRQG